FTTACTIGRNHPVAGHRTPTAERKCAPSRLRRLRSSISKPISSLKKLERALHRMTGSFKPGEQTPYPIWTHEYGKLVGAPGFDPGRLQQSAVPVYKTEPHASADAVIGRSGRKRTGDLFVPDEEHFQAATLR